ncbi:MAG: hypothetical protein A2V98_05750 [Planctomycetes bacterium RBG_16_64_12]|nr:MAG: hypothetical protein A2V98_05750 [Planctomycetes bacterium RBG_16_64_12]
MPEGNYDPYSRPTPYEILGVPSGLCATAREIGRAYNKEKRKARHIADLKERAARMEKLDRAKEQLQRPENRVLVDFFLLGNDLFADLCMRFGQKLTGAEPPTQKALGALLSEHRHDDLVPRPLEQFLGEFRPVEDWEWYDDADQEQPTLRLQHGDV